MSQNQEAGTPRPPVCDLDPLKVGHIVLRLAAASALAGHTTVESTASSYIRGEIQGNEMAFVRDLFARSTREVADRWYGGEFDAARMAADTLAARYG